MQKKIWLFRGGLSGLLMVLFLGLVSSTFAAPFVVATVTVQTNPNGVWANPVTKRTYVTNTSSNSVSVIDGLTNTVIATVPVGNSPIGVGINANTNRIFVANQLDSTTSVIDGSSNTVIANVPVGNNPVAAYANPNTNRIYVSNFLSGTVSVIDGSTNTILTTIAVGGNPYGIGVNPTTNRVYVDNYDQTVKVIDGNTNTVITSIPVGFSPNTIGINPITNRIYIPNTGSNTVTVIDGSTNAIITTITVGGGPSGAQINPVTNRLYVPNQVTNDVSVIDGTSNTVIFTIATPSPADVAVNSALNRIYLTNFANNTVTVLADPVPPTIQKAFGTASIPLNGTTSLTFTIANSNPLDKLTGVTFTDNLPAGLVVGTAAPTNTCGGTLTAAPGSPLVKLEGGTVDAAKSCTIQVQVKGTTLGDKSNTTGPISATESGAGKPSNTAVLSVKASGPQAQIRFAYLAPYNDNVDIYVNRKLVLANVTFGTVSPYLPYTPGNYAIDIIKAGANINNTDPLSSEAVDLENKASYTYSLLNFHDDTSLSSYFYTDNLKAPNTGSAKLKLLHASSTTDAIDVAIQGGQVLFRGLNNGESSEYLQLPGGDYNLEVREAGTNHVLYKIPTLSLKAGSIYTAIAEGLIAGTPVFKVDLVTDVAG